MAQTESHPTVPTRLGVRRDISNAGRAYTPNDQIYACEDGEAGVRYHSYDTSGRLARVQSPSGQHDEAYAYDGSGNRKFANGTQVTSNAVNQITQSGQFSYEYDTRGNLSAESSPTGVTRYRYNWQNLLVEVQTPDGRTVRYEYDAFGRRTRKMLAGVETRYVWCQDQLLREVVTGKGWVEQRDYLFLPGTHSPLSMRVDGRIYQYHTDHKGTPRWLTGPNGEVAWSGVTHGFGTMDVRQGSVRQPFRFPGQYYDEETGLHYNRARYYSPLLGRYLSRDPVDLVGGINLYAYVNNDPINGSDPLGLFDWGAAALLTGGIVLGAVVTAVLLPEIALTAAGLLAAAAVVTAAALVAGSVAALATDVTTDGCVPCMKAAFEKGALAGLRVGSEVVLILLTAGAAAPPLLLAEGGTLAITGQGLGAAAVAVAAAAGVMMSGSGGSAEDDDARKADAQNKADKRAARDLQKRSAKGDKDATTQLNDKKAADARANGRTSSAEGYEAENKVIRDPDNKVVKAGEEVEYADPNRPGETVATDIDAESPTEVIQVKSGGDPPSYNQAQATRLHAAETGKQPRLIYDPAKMDPDKLAQFQQDNPDFITTPQNLR